jgi:hypothetical protein
MFVPSIYSPWMISYAYARVNLVIKTTINSEEYAANSGYEKDDSIMECKIPDLQSIAKKYYTSVQREDMVKLMHS